MKSHLEPVCAAFVAEVLGKPEEDILNFISTYNAWFNSPDGGKYYYTSGK